MTDPISMQQIRDKVRGEQLLESVKSGTALHPDSPGGKSLLSSYRRWQESEQARHSDANDLAQLREGLEAIKAQLAPLTAVIAKTLASPVVSTPAVVEESAVILSVKAMQLALERKATVGSAIAAGYTAYKGAGGRLTDATWRKSLK
jgi:hypothetical protein